MNSHLRDIAISTDKWCDQHYADDEHYKLRWEEKFAELIVKDCTQFIEDTPPHYDDYRDQIVNAFSDYIVNSIMHRFGINK